MSRGNITVDPTERATAVVKPEIREVRSLKSGLIIDARRYIENLRYDRLIQVRSLIREAMEAGQPRIVCAICSTPVYIVSSTEKAFFFRHRVEDGSCPAHTRSGLTDDDVRAMKYKGAQESAAHKRLKGLIERSLRADPRFEDILVETTWHGTRDQARLRRPDVQARYGQQRLAFEAQLTTTFLDVVVGRKEFYRAEGALLVWILPYFYPSYRQLTVDDLLFNNNANVLVIDNETSAISEALHRFTMRCNYRRPILLDGSVATSWDSRLVAWDDVQIDMHKQRVFAFDCESEEKAMLERQTDFVRETKQAADDQLRSDLFDVCRASYSLDGQEMWADLQCQLADRIAASEVYRGDDFLRSAIWSLLSAREGRPIGYKFKKLIEVAHNTFEHFPSLLIPFGHMLKAHEHSQILDDLDQQQKWAAKIKRLRIGVRQGDPVYSLDSGLVPILSFLFPEIAESLRRGPTRTLSEAESAAHDYQVGR